MQPDDIEPVKKVFPEIVLFHFRPQVAVGSADDADIHGDFPLAADPGHGAFLNHAQKRNLLIKRHIADFVKKQGTAFGQLKFPRLAPFFGAGKGALRVTE
ncbi:hypothetical protein DSECCO2_658260 [anaerobic digester metagenome]